MYFSTFSRKIQSSSLNFKQEAVMASRPLAERFWEKVYKTDSCWFWIGGLNTGGYGEIGFEGKVYVATRVSWFLYFGNWPPLGKGLLHKCDIRQCVRPEHLFLGTQSDNMNDAVAKGLPVGRPKKSDLLFA